jgi:hypothetical protein
MAALCVYVCVRVCVQELKAHVPAAAVLLWRRQVPHDGQPLAHRRVVPRVPLHAPVSMQATRLGPFSLVRVRVGGIRWRLGATVLTYRAS